MIPITCDYGLPSSASAIVWKNELVKFVFAGHGPSLIVASAKKVPDLKNQFQFGLDLFDLQILNRAEAKRTSISLDSTAQVLPFELGPC